MIMHSHKSDDVTIPVVHVVRIIEQNAIKCQVTSSEHHMNEDKEELLQVLHTYDLRQCSVVLRPSAIPSENIIEIVETTVDNTSYFVFSRTSERR